MKVQEIMERAGIRETGRAVAYIKDGLEEMNLISSENIVKGTVVSTTGTGISFGSTPSDLASTSTNLLNATWTGISGVAYAETEPDNWTQYESENITDTQYKKATASGAGTTSTVTGISVPYGTLGIKLKHNLYHASGDIKTGIYRNITGLKPYVTYRYTSILNNGTLADLDQDCHIAIGTAAPSGSTVNSSLVSVTFGGTAGSNTDMSVDKTFAAPADGSIYITYYANSTSSTTTENLIFGITQQRLYETNSIGDTNGTLGSFESGMKILVDGSTNNNTDKSSNSSNGYYTSTSASANTIDISEDLTSTSAGDKITLRGQTLNYMDIIKDKRYYNLPSEAIKITDIRVKNHLNTDDQWRSIPRMIGKPTHTDKDEI